MCAGVCTFKHTFNNSVCIIMSPFRHILYKMHRLISLTLGVTWDRKDFSQKTVVLSTCADKKVRVNLISFLKTGLKQTSATKTGAVYPLHTHTVTKHQTVCSSGNIRDGSHWRCCGLSCISDRLYQILNVTQNLRKVCFWQ